MEANLEQMAADVIRAALDRGATDAECTIGEGDEFSVNVRKREVENLKEAGSKGAGLRVLVGQRTGSAYTSDLTTSGINTMVQSALELATVTTEDPHAGLPDESELGSLDTDLQLFHNDICELATEEKIRMARQAEEAALDYDPRISNSEGASFDSNIGRHVFANSRGFTGGYGGTRCSISAIPVARDGDSMERDYWVSTARSARKLEDPEAIGRTAAERAVRRLNARKVGTQKVPVVFEPRVARTLVSHVFEAANGNAIYRDASFLAGKVDERIGSENLTIIDDGTIPGLFGSSPFDDEGVSTRRTVVVDKGILKSYLLNSYTARKLDLKTTGNASRGITGNAGVGHNNLFQENGTTPPEEILKGISKGLYVTELLGFGVNIVTGDYSRGAVGLWIENGELAFPVSEITIAGTLQQMLNDVEMVGDDLQFRGSVASPTLMIHEMMISGE